MNGDGADSGDGARRRPRSRIPRRSALLLFCGLSISAGLAGVVLAGSAEPSGPASHPVRSTAVETTAQNDADATTVAPTTGLIVTTTSTEAPPVSVTEVDPRCDSGAAGVRQRAAATLMVGVDSTSLAEARQVTGGDVPVGGIFIGGDGTGIFEGDALLELSAERPLLVAVDDEGGRVQRIDGLVGHLPSAREQSGWSPERIRREAHLRGQKLRSLGVTVDFAPVVDVTVQGDTEIIGDRSYGAEPQLVARNAGSFADGLRDAGVIPTFKHFPGHGRGVGDSHRTSVRTPDLGSMERIDLAPYEALLGSGPAWVMVGHLIVPGLTEDGLPSSLSPAVYAYLRQRLGFDGVAVTDELGGMRAVSDRFSAEDAAVRAIAAGADVVLFADAAVVPRVVDALTAAVADGRLAESRLDEAYGRVRLAAGC